MNIITARRLAHLISTQDEGKSYDLTIWHIRITYYCAVANMFSIIFALCKRRTNNFLCIVQCIAHTLILTLTLIVSATLNNKSFPHRRILKISVDFCSFVHACHEHVVHSQSHTLPRFRIASPKCMQIRLSHLAGAAKKSAQHISDVSAIEHNQHIRTTAACTNVCMHICMYVVCRPG